MSDYFDPSTLSDDEKSYLSNKIEEAYGMVMNFLAGINNIEDEPDFEDDELYELYMDTCVQKLLPFVVLGMMQYDKADRNYDQLCFHRDCFLKSLGEDDEEDISPFNPNWN